MSSRANRSPEDLEESKNRPDPALHQFLLPDSRLNYQQNQYQAYGNQPPAFINPPNRVSSPSWDSLQREAGNPHNYASTQQRTFSDLMREINDAKDASLVAATVSRPDAYPYAVSSNAQAPLYSHTALSGFTEYGSSNFPNTAPRSSVPSSSSLSRQPRANEGSQESVSADPETSFEMFPCDMCAASFSRRHDLERHRRGHSGESPYVCGGCGLGFTRSDGRGRHWRLQPNCEAAHRERGGDTRRKRTGAQEESSTSQKYNTRWTSE